jgi:tetratricopeptide (TPR) repeat protein
VTLVKTRILKKAPPDLKQVLEGVQSTTLKLFKKLNAFNKNKQGFMAIIESVDANGLLKGIKVESVGLFAGDQIKTEFYQRQIDGITPIRSIADLYRVAEAVLPLFQKLLQDIAKKGGDVTVKLAPLKDRSRAKEKGGSDYADRECPGGGPEVGWVFDIVRGTLLCDSAEQIEAVVELLVADERVKVVVKFKNRFKKSTPNGFCDMLLQIVFNDGGGISHVCEVQVHLRQIVEYAAEHKSHELYDYFRVFFNGSMDTVVSRLEDLAEIVGKEFVPAEDDTAAADVVEDIVSDVLASGNRYRLASLALLCRSYLSELDLAIYIFKTLIEVCIAEIGSESAPLSVALNDFGVTLVGAGKLGEGLETYQKSLAIGLKTIGPEHSFTGGTYENIGNVLHLQGKSGEAIAMYEKSLAIKLKTLGPEDSAIATTYMNIGNAFSSQRKLGEAIEMYEASLTIKLKTLGPVHSSTADTYENMGVALKDQGNLGQGMKMNEKSLAIYLKTLGPEHTTTAMSYANMGVCFRDQGKPREAMAMYEKSLPILLKTLGPEHSSIASMYKNMAIVLLEQEKHGQAESMYKKLLALQLKTLGPEDSSTVGTYNKIGVILEVQGKLGEAMELFQKALAIQCKTLGLEHSSTTQTLNCIARVMQKQPSQEGGFALSW